VPRRLEFDSLFEDEERAGKIGRRYAGERGGVAGEGGAAHGDERRGVRRPGSSAPANTWRWPKFTFSTMLLNSPA